MIGKTYANRAAVNDANGDSLSSIVDLDFLACILSEVPYSTNERY